MTASFLELIVDWLRLVFPDVIIDIKVLLLLVVELAVQLVAYHLIDAALEGQQLAGIIVPEAYIVCDVYATANSFD